MDILNESFTDNLTIAVLRVPTSEINLVSHSFHYRQHPRVSKSFTNYQTVWCICLAARTIKTIEYNDSWVVMFGCWARLSITVSRTRAQIVGNSWAGHWRYGASLSSSSSRMTMTLSIALLCMRRTCWGNILDCFLPNNTT